MRHRLAVLTLASSLVGILALTPVAGPVLAQAAPPGLVVPNVTGQLARGGQFAGQLTVTRLSYRAGQLSADGLIVGAITIAAAPAGNLAPSAPADATVLDATATPVIADDLSTVTATATSTATATTTVTPAATASDVGAVQTEHRFSRADLTAPPAYQSTAVSQPFRDVPLTLMDPTMGVCDVLHLDLAPVFLDQQGVQLDLATAAIDIATLPRASRPVGSMLCAVASLLEGAPTTGQIATLNELLPVLNRALGTPPGR